MIDRVPEELWMEVRDIVQEAVIKTIPKRKKWINPKWLSEEALEIAEKRREAKHKGESQDGGGVGRGEHFLPLKFIKRTFKHRVNSTKQLPNAGRGHQAPRKAAQLFERR